MRLLLVLSLVLDRHILSTAFPALRSVKRPYTRRLHLSHFATKPSSSASEQIHDEVQVVKASQYVPVYFDSQSVQQETIQEARRKVDTASILNIVIPTIVPILAFFAYESLAHFFETFLDAIETKTWVAVDGGKRLNNNSSIHTRTAVA